MTRRVRRRGAALAVGALLLAAVAGCAAAPGPPTSPRTLPNLVERTAVERTTTAFAVETGDARLPWVQLWTSAQFPAAVQRCVGEQSHGQLSVQIGLPELSMSYHIVGSGSWPDEAESARIVARCAAATPIDDRVLRLAPRDWHALYSYELTTLRPCLLARGYPVTRMPSRAEFERRLQEGHPWSPYDTVTVPNRFVWYRVSDDCPPLPPVLAADVADTADVAVATASG